MAMIGAGVAVAYVVMEASGMDAMGCKMIVSSMALSDVSVSLSSIAKGAISGKDYCEWYGHGWC